MQKINTKRKSFTFTTVMLAVACAGLALSGSAIAKSKRYTITADYCKIEGNSCGAIVYAVATSNYYVNKVFVKARDTQQWDNNPACAGLDMNSTMDLRVSEYGVFIVPASCSYRLQIHIGAGDKKTQHVFVTPGCQIVLESKGTTLNDNKPKVTKVQWSDKGKATYLEKGVDVSGTPVSDTIWHAAQQVDKTHYCNKDDNANKAY